MEAPTVRLCDCPNGCVVLQFGYVSVHLSRGSFGQFVRQVARAAAALDEARPARAEG